MHLPFIFHASSSHLPVICHPSSNHFPCICIFHSFSSHLLFPVIFCFQSSSSHLPSIFQSVFIHLAVIFQSSSSHLQFMHSLSIFSHICDASPTAAAHLILSNASGGRAGGCRGSGGGAAPLRPEAARSLGPSERGQKGHFLRQGHIRG